MNDRHTICFYFARLCKYKLILLPDYKVLIQDIDINSKLVCLPLAVKRQGCPLQNLVSEVWHPKSYPWRLLGMVGRITYNA